MNEIEKQLNEYINNKLYNYAFLIKGQWGCGKSYFIKEFIKKNEDGNKAFFSVSLNGLTDLNDIDIKLIEEITKNVKKKPIQMLTIDNLKKQLNVKNIVGIMNKDYFNIALNSALDFITDTINRENVVLIFDDLERCTIDYDKLLAYINNYVEIQEMKVIIIANEDEIEEDSIYYQIKEKIVGHTMEFVPDIKENYRIFSEKIQDTELKEIILNNETNLYEELEKQNYSNMRTLQFIIDKYVNLYNIVLKNSQFHNDRNLNETIFKYIVFSSIMYKKGMKKYNWNDKDYGYVTIVEGNYAIDNFRYGFKFIDDYIYAGILNKEYILNVLNKYNDNILPNDNPYSILRNNYWEMEDIDIYKYVESIKEYLLKKLYKSGMVLDILMLLLKLENRGYNIDINSFKEMFKDIIKYDYENNTLSFNNSLADFMDTNESVKRKYFESVEEFKDYIAKLRFDKINQYTNNSEFSKLNETLDSNIMFNFISENGFFCNINLDNLLNGLKNDNCKTVELMQFKYFCDKLLSSPMYMRIVNKEKDTVDKLVVELEALDIKENISRKNAIKSIAINLKQNINAILEQNKK